MKDYVNFWICTMACKLNWIGLGRKVYFNGLASLFILHYKYKDPIQIAVMFAYLDFILTSMVIKLSYQKLKVNIVQTKLECQCNDVAHETMFEINFPNMQEVQDSKGSGRNDEVLGT